MDRGRRLAMALVGVAVTLAYVAAGVVAFYGIRGLWRARAGPAVTAATFVVVVCFVVIGNYYVGTARVLESLGAVPLPAANAPVVHYLTDQLCMQMRLTRPRLFVADLDAPNAFAIGGARGGSVVLDRSILRMLSVREVRALLAHELAHLESHDSFVRTASVVAGRTLLSLLLVPLLPLVLMVTGVARGAAWLEGRPDQWASTPAGRLRAGFASLAVLFLFGFTLVARSYARRRELAADDRAVAVTNDPLALASALRKLHRAADPRWALFSTLYVAPREDELTRLLSSHPPLDERIERLVDRVEPPEQPRLVRIDVD